MTKNNNKIFEARVIFDSGFNCCQAVFTPFAIKSGMDEQTSLKISSGFAAGLCYQGETCGAVIGAHMVLGLMEGYHEKNNQDARAKVKSLIEGFRIEFVNRHGSTQCKELLGTNPATEEGMKYLKENGIFEKKCPGFVADSVYIIEELLSK